MSQFRLGLMQEKCFERHFFTVLRLLFVQPNLLNVGPERYGFLANKRADEM